MKWRLLRSSKSREQKKEAPSWSSTNSLSAIVCAMVLFPVPANPLSQWMGGLAESLDQCSISTRIALRVPLRQPLRPPCRCSASCAQRKPLRTAASAAGGQCQIPVIESRRCSNLGPVEIGYSIFPDTKGKRSPVACIPAHSSSFVGPSVVCVNMKNGAKVIKEHKRT